MLKEKSIKTLKIGAVVLCLNVIIGCTSKDFKYRPLGSTTYKVVPNIGGANETEQVLNDVAAEGWEFVGTKGDLLIFKK